MQKKLLMIPGPCDVEEDVLQNMGKQVVCHYGHDWVKIYNDTRNLIKKLLNTSGEVFIVNGSGHLAVETMLLALAEEKDELAVVDNGFFAHRMIEILKTYNLSPKVLEIEWGKNICPEQVEKFLNTSRGIKTLAIVHSETSTGVLTPIKDIGGITRRKGVLLAVDAVSSAGIVPIDMDGWGVDMCATASQKGLGAPPGLAILAAGKEAMEYVRRRKKPVPGWYANLQVWDRFNTEQAGFQPYSITMAVNQIFALQKSLQNILDEGIRERYERHILLADMMRCGIEACGISIFSRQQLLTPVITVAEFPEDIDSGRFVDYLDKNFSILIANGLGPLRGRTVRIGHMGKNAAKRNIVPILIGLENFLKTNGKAVNRGIALDIFMK
ncbi:alanine--glyoxylate aminotransferase family protein [Biomaibacter acetigenes]|uniref:Alanine--glyoxylate aminotransferase family protein n=1 Tax=Biomaibacter acetigenes TaxID=2316383 RepID=A0A3G2R1A9_9FIRM|nr:alanine--glyoxylate aminotransferase family protein [Biomaibacter acetigenes]AYO29213.1 alanine--glyoxylate aminotransferase family protein [Biomaibacter acetigenes]